MNEFESDELVVQEQKPKLKKTQNVPCSTTQQPLYFAFLVIAILQDVFRKSETECTKIMLQAHTKGIAVVGIYTHEIAQHSIEKVDELAESQGSFLECTMEEVEL